MTGGLFENEKFENAAFLIRHTHIPGYFVYSVQLCHIWRQFTPPVRNKNRIRNGIQHSESIRAVRVEGKIFAHRTGLDTEEQPFNSLRTGASLFLKISQPHR